jgi:ribosomal protein S18 acetylase RimI-like enzyme
MTAIRKITKQDIGALKTVIDSCELFPSDLLDGMTAEFFNNKNTVDIWLTYEVDAVPVAVAYCAPERMTDGTYNLYLIAIHKDMQGKGIGTEIMTYVETLLRSAGNRVLIVETSDLPEYQPTRKFYAKIGYHQEAVIRDFYQDGENKIVFWKKLTGQ